MARNCNRNKVWSNDSEISGCKHGSGQQYHRLSTGFKVGCEYHRLAAGF